MVRRRRLSGSTHRVSLPARPRSPVVLPSVHGHRGNRRHPTPRSPLPSSCGVVQLVMRRWFREDLVGVRGTPPAAVTARHASRRAGIRLRHRSRSPHRQNCGLGRLCKRRRNRVVRMPPAQTPARDQQPEHACSGDREHREARPLCRQATEDDTGPETGNRVCTMGRTPCRLWRSPALRAWPTTRARRPGRHLRPPGEAA